MNNYRSYWKWIPICLYGMSQVAIFYGITNFVLWQDYVTNLGERIVQIKFWYKVSVITVQAINTFPTSPSNLKVHIEQYTKNFFAAQNFSIDMIPNIENLQKKVEHIWNKYLDVQEQS